jgi:murein DD-endopeptidase MepM/ murein hydrolase activator NlpD
MRRACLAIGFLWAASAPGAEVLYRLPWPEGHSFLFTQVSDGRITTHFTKATLNAVDIAMPPGEPVLAARSGVVDALEAGQGAKPEEEPLSYEGNFVRVRHEDDTVAVYAHLKYQGVAVSLGETVTAGQLIGYSGATGDVTYPHLHFAVVRTLRNSSDWAEEVSVPITFYIGAPPIAFPPRAALRVTANYSTAAEWPRAPSEHQPLVPWKRPKLDSSEETVAWWVLATWVACGIAALVSFWRFSRG